MGRDLPRQQRVLRTRDVDHTRPGNACLKAAVGVAAMAAARSRDTYLAAKYRRITAREDQ